jgi:hypothetical protein
MASEPAFECFRCGSAATEFPHTVTFGFWDDEADNYESPPPARHRYCRECWNRDFKRDQGAYWEVTDDATLWNTLAASEGQLVADLGALFMGNRPFVRVVDGDLQGAITKPKRVDEETIRFEPERKDDVDREWLAETLRSARDLPADVPVIIKPVEETPFGDVRERGGNSHKLTRWSR